MHTQVNFDFDNANDITLNRHGGNEFSRQAHANGGEGRDLARERILNALRGRKEGLTCEEAEDLLQMPHTSCSARFSELKRGNLIYVDGKRRTRSGSWAGVNHLNVLGGVN